MNLSARARDSCGPSAVRMTSQAHARRRPDLQAAAPRSRTRMRCTCIARPCLVSRSTAASSASCRSWSAATNDVTSGYAHIGLSNCTHESVPSYSFHISLPTPSQCTLSVCGACPLKIPRCVGCSNPVQWSHPTLTPEQCHSTCPSSQ